MKREWRKKRKLPGIFEEMEEKKILRNSKELWRNEKEKYTFISLCFGTLKICKLRDLKTIPDGFEILQFNMNFEVDILRK